MSVLLFLLIPLAVMVLASLALTVRHRKPQTMHSSIEGFQAQMKALSPDHAEDNAERKG